MSDLRSLTSIAPITGSFFAGQEHASAQASEEMKRQELAAIIAKRQQDTMFDAQKQPFELERARLSNEGLGITNKGNTLTNQFTEATQPGKIGATNAKHSGDVQKEQMEQAGRLSQVLEKGAIEVQSMPPMQRAMRMAELFKQNGFDPNDETVKGMILQGSENPQKAIAISKAIAQHLAQNSPGYQQATAVADVQARRAKEVAGMQIAGQKALEQMRIDAGKYDSKRTNATVNDRLIKARNPVEKAEILESAYAAASDAGDEEMAKKYAVRAMEARKRAAEDAANRGAATPRADINQLGVQSTAPPAANAPIAGGGAAQATAAAAAPQIEAGAKAAWGSYEPNKYEYRVSPEGKLQRKAK